MEHQRRKSELVALQIEKAIIQGTYSPGDRLPPERELAETYDVSRSILREAMRHIAGMGLVRTEPQSGTYVTDYGKEASLELLVYLMDNNETLNPDIFRSLLEFREFLELSAVEVAAGKSDEDFLKRLEERLERMKELRDDPETLTLRDYDFHAEIVAQTGNIAFRLLFNACRSVYLFYAGEFYRSHDHIDHTFIQLDRLMKAFEAGDAPAAVSALKAALIYGRDCIFESLGIAAATP